MPRKGLYVLPSLFTAGNLVSGFVSMIYSIEGNFNAAAWFI
jgi:phosphatidylserine synthase